MTLPKPTADYVWQRIEQFDGDPRYYGAEQACGLVFEQWPRNTTLDEILVKVTVLNRLYSTNIYDVWTVADHIQKLDIDARLASGDVTLVADIARVTLGGKRRNFYSFAAKYCAWHEPDHFPIFDSYVEWILWEYKKAHAFDKFAKYELRDYPRFVSILDTFRTHFHLNDFSRKQIDKYLWIEGVTNWR